MSKAEILENLNDINVAYNNCGMHDSLSNMLDEFEQEIRAKAIDEFVERLKDKTTFLKLIENPYYGFVSEREINEIAEQLKGGAE